MWGNVSENKTDLKNPDFSTKRKDGRFDGSDKHVVTAENIKLVKALVTHGVQTKFICLHLDISEPTLIKHYRQHMAEARTTAHSKVGQSLFKQAINGNTSAAIFYAKTQMGWKEERQEIVVNNYSLSESDKDILKRAGLLIDE